MNPNTPATFAPARTFLTSPSRRRRPPRRGPKTPRGRALGLFAGWLGLAAAAASVACTASEDAEDTGADLEGDGADTASSDGVAGPDLGASDGAGDGAGEDAADDAADADAGPPAPCDDMVPTDAAALQAYLSGGGYTGFAAESAPHESAGPHFGQVRTFVGDCLADSLDGADPQHPVGAAVVKELYGDDGTSVAGWAVMVKVAPGEDAEGWYCYEDFGGSIYADGVDVGLCTGCHDAGNDGIRTPWPLQ